MDDAELVLKILQDYYGHKWSGVENYILARQKYAQGKKSQAQMYMHILLWAEHLYTAKEIMDSLNREGLYVRDGL